MVQSHISILSHELKALFEHAFNASTMHPLTLALIHTFVSVLEQWMSLQV